MPDNPTPLSVEEARTLEGIHSAFASKVATLFSEKLDVELSAGVALTEPTTHEGFIRSLPQPLCAYTFNMQPAGISAVIAFSMPLAYSLIYHPSDGLEGTPPEQACPLTDPERHRMAVPVREALGKLENAWEERCKIYVRDTEIVRDPEEIRSAFPDEQVIHISLEVGASGARDTVGLCYPRTVVDRLDTTLETRRDAAAQILSRSWGGRVQLELTEGLGVSQRFVVSRFSVTDGPAESPNTVVVKEALRSPGHPYDPETPEGPAWRLFNEWAGLQFLTEVAGPECPAPRLYAGDRERGLVVMEDLVGGTQLHLLLQEGNAGPAEAGLMGLMATLGRMHALTVGKRDAYDGIRDALGPRIAGFDPWIEGADLRQKFHDLADVLGIAVSSEADGELDTLLSILDADGPFQVYSHQELSLFNVLMVGQEARLIDFEFGGYRHALLDGIYGRAHFPTWLGLRKRLPNRVCTRMEQVYRQELSAGCPEACDDTAFDQAVLAATLYHLLTRLTLRDLDRGIPKWIVVDRQRAMLRLDSFAKATETSEQMETLGSLARDIAGGLRKRWPENCEQLELFPAFRE